MTQFRSKFKNKLRTTRVFGSLQTVYQNQCKCVQAYQSTAAYKLSNKDFQYCGDVVVTGRIWALTRKMT